MGTWLHRHWLTPIALTVAVWMTSAGLSHSSPLGDWIVREAVFLAIAVVSYFVCSSQTERIDQAMSRRSRVIIVLAAVLGATVTNLGDAAVVTFSGFLAGAAIAFDRSGLILKRYR